MSSLVSHWKFYLFVVSFYIVAFAFFSLFFYLGLQADFRYRWISVGIFAATIIGFAIATVVYAPVRRRLRKQYHLE
jgi:hypothetical protein